MLSHLLEKRKQLFSFFPLFFLEEENVAHSKTFLWLISLRQIPLNALINEE